MRKLTLQEAADRLKEGGLLLYPTETFFGIGCKVGHDEAIARIFQIKRRLFAMPLPVILGDVRHLADVAQTPESLEPDVERLAAAFWPGPLSLILPARMHISPLLTGGTGNIAVRVSPHPAARELARRAGGAIVASSANISGQPAVSRADDLDPDLLSAVGALLDMPPAPAGGLPSTLVSPAGGGTLRILRAGAISSEQLQNAGFSLSEAS